MLLLPSFSASRLVLPRLDCLPAHMQQRRQRLRQGQEAHLYAGTDPPTVSKNREASMKALLAFVFVLGATPVLAQIQTAPPPVQASHTSAGASFSIPPSWSQRTSPSLIVLDAPENDAHLAIVDVAQAVDA